MLKITPEPDGKAARISGKFDAKSYSAVRDMPGRKKWDGSDLVFEMSRDSLAYIVSNVEANWNYADLEHCLSEKDARQEHYDRISSPSTLPPEAFIFPYKTKPRDWQAEAFLFARDKPFFGLFFEQGLGKTKTIFDIAAHKWQKGEIEALFVIAPNNVHVQWVKEQLDTHMPDFVPRKCVYWRSESTKKKDRLIEDLFAYKDGLKIFTMGQESLITKQGQAIVSRLLSSNKTFFVIDESPSIKNVSASRTKVALKLGPLAKCRAILSGTPIGKGVEDLYSQLMFLHESVLGFRSYYTFRNYFCEERQVMGAPQGVKEIVSYKNLDELKSRMFKHCIRKSARECLDLEKPDRIIYPVELTPEQKRIYLNLAKESIAQIESGEIVTAEQAAVKLMRLQQVVSGFVKDENGLIHRIPTNRPQAAMNFFKESDSKLIIWARYHEDINMLHDMFKDYKHVLWDGRTGNDERIRAKEQFMDDDKCMLFIANQAAAGTGLDGFQKSCRRMLYFTNNFKATDRWQSEARLVRMGQEEQVLIGDLEAKGTVDLKVRMSIIKREKQAYEVLDKDRDEAVTNKEGIQSFSMNDFISLITPSFED